jgi:hypothetical protein
MDGLPVRALGRENLRQCGQTSSLPARSPQGAAREATSDEVRTLRREAGALKEVVADLTLENRLLKKSMTGAGEDGA